MNRIQTESNFDAGRKVWSGPKAKQFYGDEMTIGEVVLSKLSRIPDKVIQVDDVTGEELTAGELLRATKSIARNLQRRGLKIGDVVGVCAAKSKYLAPLFMASLLCGAPPNALYTAFDKDMIKIPFKVTKPKIVFCDVENFEIVREAMGDLDPAVEIRLLNGKLDGVPNIEELLDEEALADDCEQFPCAKLNGDDTAFIVCSSGSTGTAKATICSHKALLNNDNNSNFLTPDSVVFTFSPMLWISGIITLLTSLINGAKHLITNRAFSPEYLLDIVERQQVTHMFCGAQQIVDVVKISCDTFEERLSSIRYILCGGSTLHPSISKKMNAALSAQGNGLCIGYGMTELGVVSLNTGKHKREGSVGKLLANFEVRIVGASGELMGVNESGVLHVRVPFLWAGYYCDEAKTQLCYDDGWIKTTDLGHFDEDGYLYFDARQSDIFKSNQIDVNPDVIEEVIMLIPGVQETCVFGVADLVATNLIACAISRSNSGEGRELTEERVTEEIAKHFGDLYRMQGGVFFVDALPKTITGKILRRCVPQWIQTKISDKY